MSQTLSAVRGMKDILPEETPLWHWLEAQVKQVMHQYAYQEIRFPILEKTALFKRSVGETTDIVEKEMYTFEDRNGDNLSLRPEGTAGCMRAGIEHSLFYNQIAKLWYYGPLFRHERPQKGRYRQFYQLGVEVCGITSAQADVEVILLSAQLLKSLGLLEHVTLQLNSLGKPEDRKHYRELLVQYFKQHENLLDEDSKRRLDKNPLRILDSKNPDMQSLIENAPKLSAHLSEAANQHFQTVCEGLTALGVQYELNPTLVRGLDYYCDTVFEWVTDQLGAQGTVCAGGRYDGLVEQLGGKPTPGIGFAMGIERAIALIQAFNIPTGIQTAPDVYVFSTSQADKAIAFAEALRTHCPTLAVQTHLNTASMKSLMKKADKSGAAWAVILGEQELASDTVTLKSLRETGTQETLSTEEALAHLAKIV